jgi:hypothetical protein
MAIQLGGLNQAHDADDATETGNEPISRRCSKARVLMGPPTRRRRNEA